MAAHRSAKVTRPRTTGIVPRVRLLEVLDEARGRPLTWISGPPGAGKSMLVASWLDSRKCPSLWYRLDDSDSDVSSFLATLGSMLPGGKGKLPVFRDENHVDPASLSRLFFRWAFQRLPERCVLVLDGLDFVSSVFDELLEIACLELPEGCCIQVIGRRAPAAALARLEVHGSVVHLGWPAIRLTLDESRLIAHSAGISDEKVVAHIHQLADGWAAGLRLLIEHELHRDSTLASRPVAPGTLFDYFAAEVFDQLDLGAREVLLSTSLLRQITPVQATQLTGDAHAASTLTMLATRHLFVEQLDTGRAIFQVHSLFRDYLQSRARDERGEHGMAILGRQTARLLLAAGQVRAAIPLLCRSGEWVDAGRLVLQEAPSMIACGQARLLRQWMRELPRWYVDVTPRLLYCLGVTQISESPALAMKTLEQAYDRFRGAGNVLGECLSAASIIQSYYFAFDHYVGIARWIDALRDALKRRPVFPSPETELHVWSMLQVALTCGGPSDPDTDDCATHVLRLISQGLEINQTVVAAATLLTLFDQMDPDKARLLVAYVRPLAASENVTVLNRIWWGLAECYHWSHEGARDSLRREIEHVESLISENAIRPAGAFQWVLRMFEHFAAPQTTMNPEVIDRAEAALNAGRRQELLVFRIYASHYALTTGEFAEAERRARQAVALARETQHSFSEIDALDMLACALVESGNGAGALETLREARAITGSLRAEKLDFGHGLIEAAAELQLGRTEHCGAILARVFALGRSRGWIRSHFWVPSLVSRLCAVALERGIETRYALELIRRNELPPPVWPGPDAWPWHVRVRLFGKFSVEVDGTTLIFPGKAQKRPLELLKFLAAHGGDGVSLSVVADLLWPDSEGDAAESAVRMAIHRLRKLLGHERSVLLRNGRVVLDPATCWVDGWALEHVASSVKAQPDPDLMAATAIDTARTLTRLYRGPAFGDEAMRGWMDAARDRYAGKFVSAISRIAEYAESVGDISWAASLYGHAAEADPIGESHYQGLMRCHLRAGQPAKAFAAYRKCRDSLSIMLGLRPSAQTEVLRQEITQLG